MIRCDIRSICLFRVVVPCFLQRLPLNPTQYQIIRCTQPRRHQHPLRFNSKQQYSVPLPLRNPRGRASALSRANRTYLYLHGFGTTINRHSICEQRRNKRWCVGLIVPLPSPCRFFVDLVVAIIFSRQRLNK